MKIIKYFGENSDKYLKFRPDYPDELFQWLNDFTPCHKIALDCGTGNGQAALKLAKFFDKVIAIDINKKQLEKAYYHPKIKYQIMPAEKISLENKSIDLIASASAAHWFNLEKFYKECKRLLKPQGRIVIWTYSWPQTENNQINKELIKIKTKLSQHWEKESLLHLNQYTDLQFPFTTLESPKFKFEMNWSLNQLINFFTTWVCIKKYILKIDENFLKNTRNRLQTCWPKNSTANFIFPIYLKAGKL